jgi:hypothetical protein
MAGGDHADLLRADEALRRLDAGDAAVRRRADAGDLAVLDDVDAAGVGAARIAPGDRVVAGRAAAPLQVAPTTG